jgi:3'(2'), 5'-bisphosphate nucleotidase
MPALSELIAPVVRIARRAGSAILRHYDRAVTVEKKADASPLTAADMESHALITAALARLTRRVPVLSEESADVAWEDRRTWQEFWLVDPLDGTKEFIERNGDFTVNIALVRNHVPVLGVVHAPAHNLTYWGAQGSGAWRQSGVEVAQPIHVERPAAMPVRVVGSRSHRGTSLDAFLERLGDHTLVAMGSAFKFCVVAEGRADVYPRFGPTSEWDTAAAQAVLSAAGGWTVDLQGAPLRYNTKPDVLNPHFIAFGDDDRDWWSLA